MGILRSSRSPFVEVSGEVNGTVRLTCLACGEFTEALLRQDDGEWICPSCQFQQRVGDEQEKKAQAKACPQCGERDEELREDGCGQLVCTSCYYDAYDAADVAEVAELGEDS